MVPHFRRIHLAFLALLFSSLACNLDFIGEALGRINTTPTDCDAPAFVVTLNTDVSRGLCNSQCSLRDAIRAANTCPGADVIQLSAGIYSLSVRGSGDNRGDLDITEDITIQGASAAETTIRPAGSWNDRIIEVAPGVTVNLRDLTVSGGNLAEGQGGGIFNAGNLQLEGVVLQGNIALGGGGLYNRGQAILIDTEVLDNAALGDFSIGRGGYVRPYPDGGSTTQCGGGIANEGTLTITGGLVSGNRADIGGGLCNARGGALTLEGGSISGNNPRLSRIFDEAMGGGIATFSNLTATGTAISENRSSIGAGLYVLIPRGGRLHLDDVTVQGNWAMSEYSHMGDGGGLFIKSGEILIENSRILDNRADHDGGGLNITPGSGGTGVGFETELGDDYRLVNGEIHHSSIARNRAGVGDGIGRGGGVFHTNFWGSGSLIYENVTISRNLAYGEGGAFYLRHAGAAMNLVNVTVAMNWGRTTSGINLAGGDFRLRNTLIVGNSPWNCRLESGHIYSDGYNLESGNLCQLDQPTDISARSSDTFVLTDLSEVGGQFVHLLFPSTRAVDRIPLDLCPADDQRGMSRPQGVLCDVGAYELDLVTTSLEVTPLALETITPTPAAAPLITFTQNANCRKGPGTPYEIVTSATAGQAAQIEGRSQASDWYYVLLPSGTTRCWVAASTGTLSGSVDGLSVIPAPSLPTATFTAAPSKPPAPELNVSNQVCDATKYVVRLSWKDVAGETGYRVYRDGVLVATLGAGVTVYDDTSPDYNAHDYRVESFNAPGASSSAAKKSEGCLY